MLLLLLFLTRKVGSLCIPEHKMHWRMKLGISLTSFNIYRLNYLIAIADIWLWFYLNGVLSSGFGLLNSVLNIVILVRVLVGGHLHYFKLRCSSSSICSYLVLLVFKSTESCLFLSIYIYWLNVKFICY